MAKIMLIAYAYHQDDPTSAPAEERKLNSAFGNFIGTQALPSATSELISDKFSPNNDIRDDIQIFHFAGHAEQGNPTLNDEDSLEVKNTLDVAAFATVIQGYGRGLKLVFLNACNTANDAQCLVDIGMVLTVIGTTIPVPNRYALRFALVFYEFFIQHKKTVEEALKEAHDRAGMTKEEDLETRGNIKRPGEQIDPKSIYQIFGDKTQRFADWPKGELAQKITNIEKEVPVDLGLQEDAFLLCNRDDQARQLFQGVQNLLYDRPMIPPSKKCRTNLFGLPQAQIEPCKVPLFVLVNSSYQNGPFEFLARFEKYILKLHWPQNSLPVADLGFPAADDFDLDGDPNKPLETLRGIYSNHLLSTKSGEAFDQDLLFVTRHALSDAVWKEGYAAFFEAFIKEESQKFQHDLKRLVVICWLQHTGEGVSLDNAKKYDALFCQLKARFPKQVLHFCNFPLVNPMHVVEWHQDLYDDTVDPDDYNFEDSMPFLKAKKVLKKIISDRYATVQK